MASKKIPVLVLVATVILALSLGILSAFDGSVSGVGHEHGTLPLISEEPTVTPLEGKYTDWFNYTLVLEFYENATIKLEIEKVGGGWGEIATREYNKSPYARTLLWNVAPFSAAYVGKKPCYRFKWGDIVLDFEGDLEFPGPTIVEELIYEFKNETVIPPSGYYNISFRYSVEFKSNKNQSITLEVYNFSRGEWEKVRGTQRYTDIGNPEVLSWPGISHIASSDSGYVFGKYRFSFMDYGERYESNIYRDPLLLPLVPPPPLTMFKNATVSPPNGNFSTAFNYNVEVIKSGIEINNVTLEVYDGSWRHVGSGTNKSSDGNRWEWEPITFGGDYEGVAKYKFLCNNEYESAVYDGPFLLNVTTKEVPYNGGGGGGGGGSSYKPYMLYENAIVDPSWIVIGVREEKSFNYSVDVDRDVSSVILEIYNSSSNEWEEKGKGNESKHKDKWRHEWRVNLTLDKNWEGTSKYWFYPNKQEQYASQIFYGPEIKTMEASLAGWKKEIGVAEKPLKEPVLASATVTPSKDYWFKKFTYTAEIKHLDRANMTLVMFVYKPGSKEWKPVPWRGYRYNPIIHSSDYDNESDMVNVSWTVEKRDVFDEGDAGQRSAFHFWYWDGYNEYNESKGSFNGSMLLANKAPEFVRVVTPNPEYGSTHTVYTYTFEVNDPDNDTVYGWLTITDPLTEEHVIEGAGKDGVIKFRVGPGLGIFTEDKLREYINTTNEALFTSQYQLEYWDDCMAVKGEEPKTTAWFEGPHVSLIKIEPKMEPPDPVSGKYADEFEYHVGFYSSKDNTFWLDLTIYDSSNPEHAHPTLPTKRLSVSADTTNYTSWKVKPEVFGPADFGKNASYAIAWEDEVGNKGVLEGSGPHIERAVPLLSCNLPLVPIISMVIVPFVVFGASLLLVLYDIRGRLKGWKKQKEAKKKEKQKKAET